MIADLLPEYYERFEHNLRYEVLRSIVIDGHEVAWMSYVGTVQFDVTGKNREGEPFYGRMMMCECDFTEGVGWSLDEDGQRYTKPGQDACLIRQAALHLRHLELRREYYERFVIVKRTEDPWSDMGDCVREITLDLIEKDRAGEWLEAAETANMYGGHFYLRTVAAITGKSLGSLRKDMNSLRKEKLITMEGTLIKSYIQPPPPVWEECVRIEDDGWVGLALLPGHQCMAQEWKLQVFDPFGREAVYTPGQRLLHDPIFGPDVEDVEYAKRRLMTLIERGRRQN